MGGTFFQAGLERILNFVTTDLRTARDFALRKIPTASFAANALYLEIVRLA